MTITTPQPTPAGFLLFVRNQMQITSIVLPDDSEYLTWAYDLSISIVNLAFTCVPGPMYLLMVYNLGGSNLINFAQDQPGQTYFADLRKALNINSLTSGLVASSSDEGTSVSLLNPDFIKTLTIADLQYYKDPYGRTYLGYAQRYGPSAWGVS